MLKSTVSPSLTSIVLRSSLSPLRRQTATTCMSKASSQQASARLASVSRAFSSTPTEMSVKKIFTPKACPPAAPYTQAIVTGNTVYVSGQIPADANGNLVEGDIAAKTHQCVANIKAILEEAGGALTNIVKVNVFLEDLDNFAAMNAEYEKHFAHKPARSCVGVKALPKGVPVEIECIAVI